MDTYILDCLWNKYWTQTLSSSPLLKNKEYSSNLVLDISQKIEKADKKVSKVTSINFKDDKNISKLANDASKVGIEQAQGLTNLLLKNLLFYNPSHS